MVKQYIVEFYRANKMYKGYFLDVESVDCFTEILSMDGIEFTVLEEHQNGQIFLAL